jgi:serine/threonine protein kinase
LISEEGSGPFGPVWLAEDSTTGQLVAIRLLPRELTDAPSVTEIVRRRARSVIEASHAHPSLVRVLEYGTTDDGQMFSVMERVEGRRLSDVITSRDPLDVAAALRLATELGAPVETLHNMGLVHGGLRPMNFVLAEGRTVLMDVETIALRDASSLQHLIAQSPAPYLAPELIQGGPITEKTDVYAFAATVYELLTAVPPFTAETPEAMLERQMTSSPKLLRRVRPTIPADVEAVLADALNPRPDQRPFMPTVLDHFTAGATNASRWKRTVAIAAGLLLVFGLGWTVLAPRLQAPEISAPVPDERPVQQVPEAASGLATSPTAETSPPAPEPVRPSTNDAVPQSVVAPPPEAPPPAPRVKRPPARATTTAEPSVPRIEPPPTAAKPAAPVDSRASEDSDSAAVIDWLLRRQGR